MTTRKNPAAVALGALGGKARAKALSKERQREIASEAGKKSAEKRALTLLNKE